MLKHVDLCSGVGGFALAFQTIGNDIYYLGGNVGITHIERLEYQLAKASGA